MRENHDLQHDVDELDSKIKLLLANRTTVEEVMASQSGARLWSKGTTPTRTGLVSAHARDLYGCMFYYLQCRPQYLGALVRVLTARADVDRLVRTVVFTVYGDQYENREERLLLCLFKELLAHEFASSNGEIGTFMRATTATTSMLSSYARRPGSMAVLKEILEPLVMEICGDMELNLEVKAHAVYMALVNDEESKTGETSARKRQVTDEEAAADPAVQALIRERMPRLEGFCRRILDRLLAHATALPYGIRWICLQLDEMARREFAGAAELHLQSIVGGFVYLRYVNPAIVTPDGVNLIQRKPTPKQRRNLILVAQTLQKLANGQQFADKDAHMLPLNAFVEGARGDMAEFYRRLVAVEPLEEALSVDRYLQVRGSGPLTP